MKHFHFHFVEKISELPRTKAKTLVQTAYIAIVALFITIMVGIAITAWFLFTAPNKPRKNKSYTTSQKTTKFPHIKKSADFFKISS